LEGIKAAYGGTTNLPKVGCPHQEVEGAEKKDKGPLLGVGIGEMGKKEKPKK